MGYQVDVIMVFLACCILTGGGIDKYWGGCLLPAGGTARNGSMLIDEPRSSRVKIMKRRQSHVYSYGNWPIRFVFYYVQLIFIYHM